MVNRGKSKFQTDPGFAGKPKGRLQPARDRCAPGRDRVGCCKPKHRPIAASNREGIEEKKTRGGVEDASWTGINRRRVGRLFAVGSLRGKRTFQLALLLSPPPFVPFTPPVDLSDRLVTRFSLDFYSGLLELDSAKAFWFRFLILYKVTLYMRLENKEVRQ